ncbi:hypothetical protein ABN306_11835 [Providencia huaxiensis]|uniref:Fimbrial protein n=1 Tax=Providencia huaxiensis TaxID=2027290 RepID=A0A8I2DDA5_9GAMM|nr:MULTISPECIES: hypothetical protein [Providencia]MBQ0270563.1 hypothetical protein [Providencia huaxiensis]
MKLHHLGLWMLAMPIFVGQAQSQTTGTVFVHARLVAPLCQPKVTVQRGVSHINTPIYQFNISFAHCLNAKRYKRLPFSITLGQTMLSSSRSLIKDSLILSVPENNSARRLELNYD